MKEEIFEAVCPTCGKKNEIKVKLRDSGFNQWEEIHCAHCGLMIEDVMAAQEPETKII